MIMLKKIIYDIQLVFLNFFVAYIPIWIIRKSIYKFMGMKIGKHSRINQRVYIYNPWNIEIGNNTIVNSFSLLDGRGGLKIGSSSSISMRATIYSASHKTDSCKFEYYKNNTVIGDCCWIGVGAVILQGSTIEDRVVIGANSVFKGESQIGGIYVGNPAELLRKRNIKENYDLEIKEFFT